MTLHSVVVNICLGGGRGGIFKVTICIEFSRDKQQKCIVISGCDWLNSYTLQIGIFNTKNPQILLQPMYFGHNYPLLQCGQSDMLCISFECWYLQLCCSELLGLYKLKCLGFIFRFRKCLIYHSFFIIAFYFNY